MAYNVTNCVAALGTTGLSNCLDNLGYDIRLIWSSNTYSIADQTTAETLSTWTDDIDAKNVYPLPLFDEIEPAIEDNVEQDLATGVKLFVREGKYGGIGRYQGALCDIARLRTFNNVSGRAFIVTSNGQIWGTSPDGTVFKGFTLSELFFTGLGGTDGSTKRFFSINYQMKNPTEMFDFPAVINPTWSPLDLTGLIGVTVTVVGVPTASELIVNVARDCDGEAVDGLVEADFVILDAVPAAQPTTGFTDNDDGTYTFTFAADLETGTVNLAAPTVQTTGGYQAGAAAAFTI